MITSLTFPGSTIRRSDLLDRPYELEARLVVDIAPTLRRHLDRCSGETLGEMAASAPEIDRRAEKMHRITDRLVRAGQVGLWAAAAAAGVGTCLGLVSKSALSLLPTAAWYSYMLHRASSAPPPANTAARLQVMGQTLESLASKMSLDKPRQRGVQPVIVQFTEQNTSLSPRA